MQDIYFVIAFNTIGSGLGWASLGMGISAIVSPNWINDGGIRSSGLWELCTTGQGCVPLQAESWLLAVRAFMIIFVILVFLGMLANITAYCTKGEKGKKSVEGSGGILSIAGLFALVGAAIYTGITQQGQFAVNYGISYSYAWAVVGMAFMAGLFVQLGAWYIETCDETPPKEEA